jgi:hypothetical protein
MDRTANWCTGGYWFTLAQTMEWHLFNNTFSTLGRQVLKLGNTYGTFFITSLVLVVCARLLFAWYMSVINLLLVLGLVLRLQNHSVLGVSVWVVTCWR